MVLYRAAVTGCAGKYQCSAKRLIRSLTSSATSHRRMGIIRYHNSASVACNHEVTIITIKPVHARALVAAYPLQTYSSISTRRRGALVSNFRAGISGIASCAGAAVSIDIVCTHRTICTWRRIALVDICRTVHPSVTRDASAAVRIHSLRAGATVYTWAGAAFIDVDSTVGTRIACHTCAAVYANPLGTRGAVSTGIGSTFVNVSSAVDTRIPPCAGAAVSLDFIYTQSVAAGI